MNIENINFKKVFLAFFATFLIFTVVSVSIELSNGRWEDAVTYEQHRLETGQSRGRFGGRHEREGRTCRRGQNCSITSEASIEQPEEVDALIASPHGAGDRVIYSVARHYVRVTSPEFGMLNLLGCVLKVAFVILLALWVHVDSKKHAHHPLLWAGLTLFFHLFGLILYLIVRERKRTMDRHNG